MTRRAFVSSKSNTGAGEIHFEKANQKSGNFGQKKENISESVNSFAMGAIFLPRSDQELSNGNGPVSVYAL